MNGSRTVRQTAIVYSNSLTENDYTASGVAPQAIFLNRKCEIRMGELRKVPAKFPLGGSLTLGELETFTGPGASVFFTFDFAGITGEETCFFQRRSEFGIGYDQGSGNA